MKGTVPVNDDVGLEQEADVMGAKAMATQLQNQRVAYDGTPQFQSGTRSGDQREGDQAKAVQHPANMMHDPIQCRFKNGKAFLKKTADTVDFQAIAAAMNAYNQFLDNQNKQPKDYGVAAGKLQLIERKIFAYISANNAGHEKLSDIPHYQELEALRIQAGKEHENFVETAAAGDHLPFDFTGMPTHKSVALIRLWNQIKGGMGKIQLVGDPANKKRMLSWLVKLLETPTGRDLLGYLNAGDPNEALTNIYIGQTKSQLPKGVESGAKGKGKTLEDRNQSEAQPLGNTGEILGPFDLKGDESPRDYLTAASVADFRTALLQNKIGVILNGKKYEFNKAVSVGSFVTAHEGASKNESAVHHQIMTPGWLTMGHELGHAAHMRGGGTNMIDTANSPGNPGIMETLTRDNAEKLNAKWQNGEEFLTIHNWENGLRGDVGLTARDSHIPYTAGKKVERYYSIYPDIKTTFNDGAYSQAPSLKSFIKDLKTAFNSKDPNANLENDLVYQALQQRWNILRGTNLDAEAIQFKKDLIKQKFDAMETKYRRKKDIYDKKWWFNLSKEQKSTWRRLTEERNEIVDICRNHLDDHIDLNVAPDRSLFVIFENRIDAAEKAIYDFKL
jgi:hypothetical protein